MSRTLPVRAAFGESEGRHSSPRSAFIIIRRYSFFPMYNTEKPHNNEELTYNNNRLDYYIDANGYLHFITEYAGDIIISDGVLMPQGQNTR